MDTEALRLRLLRTFSGELDEHLRTLERDLLAWERGAPDQLSECLESLSRSAHSLKGAARAVDLEDVVQLAHLLESVFESGRETELPLPRELGVTLFEAVDWLRKAAAQVRGGRVVERGELSRLFARLGKSDGDHGGGEVRARIPLPEPRELPSTAVAKDTARIEPILARTAAEPDLIRVAGERLERLLGLGGELLVVRRRTDARMPLLREIVEQIEAWQRQETRSALRPSFAHTSGEPPQYEPPASTDEDSEERGRTAAQRLAWVRRRLLDLESALTADRREVDRVATPLEREIIGLRLVPFAEACEGFERAARDLAQTEGKQVEIRFEGAELEIDRALLHMLRNALLHLLRNAVAHGIEAPAERVAGGKSPTGSIIVAAGMRGGQLEISVADDGAGLDLAAIAENARSRGLTGPLTDADLAKLVFTRGVTTSAKLSTLAGRGVGLDAVRDAVELRRGTADVDTGKGTGCRFVLRLPLSAGLTTVLLLKAGNQTWGIDRADVQELRRIAAESLRSVEGRDVVVGDGHPLPIRSLVEVLGIPSEQPRPSAGKFALLVLGADAHRVALVVDEMLAEQSVVVKSLDARLGRVPNISGAAQLASGEVALILDAHELISNALGLATRGSLAPVCQSDFLKPLKRILVVDDSVTTRTLVEGILNFAGYQAATAADGKEAWDLLQTTRVDLMVSDVDMPGMNGFELTQAVRSSRRLQKMPIVLVTSRESEADRLRGMESGADAYIRKSTFDQTELLKILGQLV